MQQKLKKNGKILQNKTAKPPKGSLLMHSADLFDKADKC